MEESENRSSVVQPNPLNDSNPASPVKLLKSTDGPDGMHTEEGLSAPASQTRAQLPPIDRGYAWIIALGMYIWNWYYLGLITYDSGTIWLIEKDPKNSKRE